MAGDGRIVIDVILDDGSVVKGVADLDKQLGGLGGSGEKAALGIGSIVTALGLVAIASKGIDMVREALDGAIDRYDTLNAFPRVMQMIGFDAEESQGAINKLSEGIQGLPTRLDAVASTAQNIAVLTGDLDGAVDTTLALNNAFLASGSSSADAERGLQQYVQMLSKGEVDLQSWRTLQETMGPALNKTAEAFGFAGASAQNDLYDALKKGDITFDQFNGKLIELDGAVGGFADMAAEGSAGIKTSWANMKTAIVKGVADVIGAVDEALGGVGSIEEIIDKMKTGVQNAFKVIVEAIPPVIQGLKGVYEVLKPWLPLIAAVGAAFVSYVAIMQGVTAAQKAWDVAQKISIALTQAQRAAQLAMVASGGGVKGVLLAIRAAMSQLNKTMMLNPWVLAAAAAVAAVILIYKYWDPIKEFFINLWSVIKESGLVIWDALKNAWTATVEWFMSLWTPIAEFFSNLWLSITTVAISVWDAVVEKWNSLVTLFVEIFSPAIEFYSNLWTTITETAVEIFNIFSETLSVVWTNIQTIAAAAWEIIKNVILGPILLLINLATGDFGEFASNLSAIQENIRAAAGRIWEALKSNVTVIITALISIGTKLWNNFKDTIKNIISAIKQVASNLWEQLKSSIVSTITSLVSSALGKWNELKSRVIEIVSNIVSDLLGKWDDLKTKTLDKIKSVKDNVINPLKEINLMQIGKDIIQGLINGITSKVKAVGNAVKDVTSAITGKIKSILKIASPSKVTFEMGEWTGEGVEGGLIKSAKGVAKAAGRVAESAMPDMPKVGGFVNRLRGVTAPIGSAMPIGSNNLTSSKAEGGNTVNNNSPITVQSLVVREEADIKKVARELFILQQGGKRVVLG